MRTILLVIFTAIFMFFFAEAALAQSGEKIGYVDLSTAFDEYQKTKDFDKALEKKGDLKQEQREKLVKEIRNLREELDLLNEKARSKKEEDIEAKIRFLQEFDQDAKSTLTKERDDMVRDILQEMNTVIQEYGEENGYSIILNDRVLLYGEESEDLTDEIVKILNDNYKR